MLKRAAGVIGCLLVALTSMGADQRTYTAGRFSIAVDGSSLGLVKSVSGGNLVADVVVEPAGPNQFPGKHLGNVRCEDIVIEARLDSPGVQKLIQTALQGNQQPHNGSVYAADFDGNITSELQFSRALVSEVTIPAFDASSKEAAYVTIKLSPENVSTVKGSGKLPQEPVSGKNKAWMVANFRVQIDGLDCSKVMKVDSITVKSGVSSDATGQFREPTKQPGQLQFPNVKITFADVSASSWQKWFDQFVVKGQNDQSQEKKGSIVFLAANMKDELAAMNFYNLGICALRHDKEEANSDKTSRMTAELYCERMELASKGQDTAAAQDPAAAQTAAQEAAPPAQTKSAKKRQTEAAARQEIKPLPQAEATPAPPPPAPADTAPAPVNKRARTLRPAPATAPAAQ